MFNYLTMGYDCSPASTLQNLKLRNFALPFDWVVSNVVSLEKCFEDKFIKYHTNLRLIENNTKIMDEYGFIFPHDYPNINYWINDYNTVREKYCRRIERFNNIINDKKPIIVLCRYNTNEVLKLKELFLKYYNKNNIYFINSSQEIYSTNKIKNIYTEQNGIWNDVNIWKANLDNIITTISSTLKSNIINMNKEIIIEPRNGLCNRLRFLFSFIYKLKMEKRFDNTKLVVFWPIDSECNFFYLDCIINSYKNIRFIQKKENLSGRINISSGGIVLNKGINYLKLVNFSPKLNILNIIHSIINKNLGNKYIAAHIRRTDHIGLAKKNNNFTPDDDFINFFNKYKDYNIYIATDCLDTQIKFKNIFKNRIKYMKMINNNIKEKRKTDKTATLIDMFICAFSNIFKGSGYSSYTDMILNIRNCNNLNNNIKFSSLDILNKYINNAKNIN